MTFTAIIPARRKDKILKDKNILEFADSNLLVHKILQLKKVKKVNEILVSTECNEIAKIAKDQGVSIDQRPIRYSGLNANFNDFVKYISTLVKTENILWAPVTCPLVTSSIFDSAISKFKFSYNKGFDSLISCNKIKRFLLDNNGPLNFRFYKSSRKGSKLPVFYEFINAITIARAKDIEKWKYNWGKVPYFFELKENFRIDICSKFDYEIAKIIYKNQNELYY